MLDNRNGFNFWLTFEPIVVFFEASDSICGWPGFLFLWQMRAIGEKRNYKGEKQANYNIQVR